MDCSTVREGLSALLDGEPTNVAPGALDAHLARCPGCRRWRSRAHAVTRRSRLSSAPGVPSPSESLLAAARAAAPRRGRSSVTTLTRVALVAIAFAQLAVTVPVLVLGSDHDSPMHVAHEMGSFDMALAVGFLAAALRPTRARGMSVVVGAAALLLVVTALIDLDAARTTPADEAPHLLAVAGWLLLRRLIALTPSSDEHRAAPSLTSTARSWLQRAVRLAFSQRDAQSETFSHAVDPAAGRAVASPIEPSATEAPYDPLGERALAG